PYHPPIYFFLLLPPPTPRPTLFPYTTLFRSIRTQARHLRLPGEPGRSPVSGGERVGGPGHVGSIGPPARGMGRVHDGAGREVLRSEEHTSELQSRENLVCRLLLEKKKQESRT